MTVIRLLKKLRFKLRRSLHRLILERRYGMPKGALREVDLKDVGLEAEDRVRHVPSQWGILRRVLRPSEVDAQDVFIDFGSGVGSVLAEAAAFYPFRRVIGVELAPQFSAAAREMLTSGKRRYRCPDIQVHTADVTEFEIPDDVTVVYMFDPFHGEILQGVIDRLIASVDRNPRRLRIIYCTPTERWRFERTGRVRLLRYGRRPLRPWSRADYLLLYEVESARDERPAAQP